MKLEHKLFIAILFVAVLLRSIGLDSRSIQYDDAFSILLAQQSLPSIVAGTAADTMPPLYYFVLHFWMQIGQAVWFLRLPGLLFNVATVILLYLLVRDLAGGKAGLWAAFLAAISPLQIYHAQDIRVYSLLALGLTGYAWFFARLWLHPEATLRRDWVGFVLFGVIAMYCHNLAAFALVVPDLFLLWRRQGRFLGRVVIAQLVVGLFALPWLFFLPGQIAKVQYAFWTPRPGIVDILQALVMFTSNLPLPPLWLAGAFFASLLALVFILFEIIRNREIASTIPLLAFFALVPPSLLFVVSYLMRPVFVTRGFLISALAYAGIAGVVIARRWPLSGAFIATAFLAGAAIALPYQYTFEEFPRSSFRQAAAYLQEHVQPGDRVVNDNKLSYFPLHFLRPGLPQSFLPDSPGSGNDTLAPGTQRAMNLYPAADLSDAVGSSKRVFFVVFREAIDEYRGMGNPDHPVLLQLNESYHLVGRQVFGDLEIYEFQQ